MSLFVRFVLFFTIAVPAGAVFASEKSVALPQAVPGDVGMSAARLDIIDEVVAEGLRRERMPGCVVLVGHRGHVVYHKAFGFRQTQDKTVEMTVDTVFDLASLTKPIATASSVMMLVQDGKLNVDDKVVKYLPEFGANGKDVVTLRQLLTHTAGLIPDNSIRDYADGHDVAIQKICDLKKYAEPGKRFAYSDVGFIVLGEIVQRVSRKSVAEFSRERIYQPLGMQETMFVPTAELRKRAAPTEKRDGEWMRGEVHDPRAWALGGVAGHAGLFSTASDLAVFCDMLVNEGKGANGAQVLDPETVRLMGAAQKTPSGLRTLGWDMRSPYSSNRGDLFSSAAYGHGGFTGTAMWVDPAQKLFVIFLSNRVHPNGKGSVNSLAGRIATIAGAAIVQENGR